MFDELTIFTRSIKQKMKREKIAEVLKNGQLGNDVLVKGWVRAFRSNRFISINDGSTINNIQAVVDFENLDEALLKKITTAASVAVSGKLVASQGAGQAIEIEVKNVEVIGEANPEEVQKTVMQPKKHSLEFLREHFWCCFQNSSCGSLCDS